MLTRIIGVGCLVHNCIQCCRTSGCPRGADGADGRPERAGSLRSGRCRGPGMPRSREAGAGGQAGAAGCRLSRCRPPEGAAAPLRPPLPPALAPGPAGPWRGGREKGGEKGGLAAPPPAGGRSPALLRQRRAAGRAVSLLLLPPAVQLGGPRQDVSGARLQPLAPSRCVRPSLLPCPAAPHLG